MATLLDDLVDAAMMLWAVMVFVGIVVGLVRALRG
jgi:hypothetical protein